MSDTISAAEVIAHFQRIKEASSTDGEYSKGFVDGLDFCIGFIGFLSTLPPAEPTTIVTTNKYTLTGDINCSMAERREK